MKSFLKLLKRRARQDLEAVTAFGHGQSRCILSAPALLSVRSQLVQVRLKFLRRQANLLLAFWRLVADQMHETLNQAMALNLTLILVLLSGFRGGAA
ncbi:hypothetical protein ROV93_16675 [Stenotrophomonas maltophilia group sp. msm4]|uniref:hypothetical protein n=1 Tax=Stenotrophomonas maltophilia group sp. msm4 TaxID=3061100 RepID=UPI0028938DD9|nr:hypothetical protein [Stenotrophomonas maltophilia group sp. msm4]MDT3491757.1 hypothetical protein [Stenotrophomonas maltophilia group sp. msm4]